VPNTSSHITIDSHARWIDECNAAFKMNSYDEHALEEALKIKDLHPETEVHAISIGPPRVLSCLKKALETGADDAFHITTGPGFIRPETTSKLIAQHICNNSYDLVLCGQMAEDDMLSATVPMLAAITGMPFCMSVSAIKYNPENNSISVTRELSSGKRQIIEISLSCVVCVQSGINTLRYPSLSSVLRAKKQQITALDFKADDLPASEYTIALPKASLKGMFIEGSTSEKAETLAAMLHERSLL